MLLCSVATAAGGQQQAAAAAAYSARGLMTAAGAMQLGGGGVLRRPVETPCAPAAFASGWHGFGHGHGHGWREEQAPRPLREERAPRPARDGGNGSDTLLARLSAGRQRRGAETDVIQTWAYLPTVGRSFETAREPVDWAPAGAETTRETVGRLLRARLNGQRDGRGAAWKQSLADTGLETGA